MRRWHTAVYVVAARHRRTGARLLRRRDAGVAAPPRSLEFAIATLFNPMLIDELGLAAWSGSIAWRSATPGAFVGWRELHAAEAVAALLGAWLARTGAAAIERQHASAARGGGLLGGFGEDARGRRPGERSASTLRSPFFSLPKSSRRERSPALRSRRRVMIDAGSTTGGERQDRDAASCSARHLACAMRFSQTIHSSWRHSVRLQISHAYSSGGTP